MNKLIVLQVVDVEMLGHHESVFFLRKRTGLFINYNYRNLILQPTPRKAARVSL